MSKTLISVLAGLGGMFGWGISDFFANTTSEKIGHTKTVFWSQIFGMILLGILMIFLPRDFSWNWNLLITFIFGSICYAGAYVYFYKAFEIGNVSVVSTTSNLNVVIGMFIAYLWKGQRLSSLQSIAVFLIFMGIVFVSVNLKDIFDSKVSLLVGVREALVAAFGFGIFWNISETLSEQVGWLATAFYVKVLSIIMLLLFFFFTKEKISYQKNHINILPFVALVGILEALAVASVNFGLQVGDLMLVDPIAAALSVVTISLAVIFLKEKLTKIQVVGVLVTVVGIVMSAF